MAGAGMMSFAYERPTDWSEAGRLLALPGAVAKMGGCDVLTKFRSGRLQAQTVVALNGLPEFTAYPGAPGPHHRATMHICPDIEYVERAWDCAKYGRPSDRPLLELTVPTMYDPSLAPPGSMILPPPKLVSSEPGAP